MNGTHVPVLVNEVIQALEVQPKKRYIDATVGLGGHTIEILKRGGRVLGLDQDPKALEVAKENVKNQIINDHWKEDLKLIHGNFRDIERIAEENRWSSVDGVLFDLGVSSMQLDTPERGMSYRFDHAPLDLRMNQSIGETASELINRSEELELYDIFSQFGEEQLSRSISAALYRARPVSTVEDVVRVVGTNKGVLSRIFQALRIAVNDELKSLKFGLEGAKNVLKPGGRLAVISFHSLEDRIVKLFMRQHEWDIITKHPIVPSESETIANRRSRSAKLRIAKKRI